jgi:hypothetical protein
MKRFLLFAGSSFYPDGGMSDFVDSFDSVKEAILHVNVEDDLDSVDWIQVVDIAGDEPTILYGGENSLDNNHPKKEQELAFYKEDRIWIIK